MALNAAMSVPVVGQSAGMPCSFGSGEFQVVFGKLRVSAKSIAQESSPGSQRRLGPCLGLCLAMGVHVSMCSRKLRLFREGHVSVREHLRFTCMNFRGH
jgi:hypothetical protein